MLAQEVMKLIQIAAIKVFAIAKRAGFIDKDAQNLIHKSLAPQ